MNKFTTKMATPPPPNFELSTINPALSRIRVFALAFCKSAGALLCFGQEAVL